MKQTKRRTTNRVPARDLPAWFATAIVLPLLSSSACNVFEARSGDLTCEGPADCDAPRLCQDGYCVLASTTPDADPSAPDADPNAPDADPSAPDAFVGPDATPSAASMHLLGSVSCGGATTEINIPSGGVAAGNVALVHIYRRSSTGSITSITDTGGNTYAEIQQSGGEGTRGFLYQSTIATPLVAGNKITVTQSNGDSAVIAVELRNATPAVASKQGATADDGLVSIGFTPATPGVVLCAGGNRGGTVQLDADWMQLENLSADCGGGQGGLTSFASWLIAGTGGISTCTGTFSFPNGFEQWVGITAAYGD